MIVAFHSGESRIPSESVPSMLPRRPGRQEVFRRSESPPLAVGVRGIKMEPKAMCLKAYSANVPLLRLCASDPDCMGKRVMARLDMLREQAAILRSLAATIDIPKIRQDLLNLAARCDHLAKELEDNPPAKTEKL